MSHHNEQRRQSSATILLQDTSKNSLDLSWNGTLLVKNKTNTLNNYNLTITQQVKVEPFLSPSVCVTESERPPQKSTCVGLSVTSLQDLDLKSKST